MRIAIDISQIIYGTGVSTYTRNLVAQLIELYPNVEFVLFGGSLRRKEELDQFVKHHHAINKINHIPPRVTDFIWNSLHILPVERLIGNVDLIHTSDWSEPPSRIPKVTTIHDLIPFKYPDTTEEGVRLAHRKRLAWVARESKAIFAVSQSTKNDIVDTLKIKPEKITVTYEGVEKILSPGTPAAIEKIRRKYRLSQTYLVTVSTIEPRKNLPRLLQAFQTVRETYPELQLVIVGRQGWGKEPIAQPGVNFVGYVANTELPAIYSGCTAYVLPSLYEGFSLTHLEAMACGAPVVGSNISSMPEVIGKAGVLVNPESIEDIAVGILKAIKNKDVLSERSLQRASLFSWNETAKLTYEIYQQVLAK